MSIPKIKKYVLIGIPLIIFVLIFFFRQGKSARSFDAGMDSAFAEYIAAYSSGTISSMGTIQINFTNDAVDSTMVGKEADEKLFDFSPSIAGKAIWANTSTIEFHPNEKLPSNEYYEVDFNLGKVFTVEKNLRIFSFSFQTIPQSIEITIDNVRPKSKEEYTKQIVTGTILTADVSNSSVVEKILSAKQNKQALTVAWTHDASSKSHSFEITGIVRKEDASTVYLYFQTQLLDIEEESIERQIEIPAMGDFKVMQVRVENGDSQYVELQFSDLLDENQSLLGLVQIRNMGTLDFKIRDNLIKVYPSVNQIGSFKLSAEAGIKNKLNKKMPERQEFYITFEQLLPAVRWVKKGNILPSAQGNVLPFEAVNLKSVDIIVLRVFEKNMLQFLQTNRYDETSEFRRVGKVVVNKKMNLQNLGVTDLGKWNRFTLDLSQLIKTEPGALYHIKILFDRSQIRYDKCDEAETEESEIQPLETNEDTDETSSWDSYESNYDEDYSWEKRDDPCNSAYYSSDRFIHQNIIASNIGLLAKNGNDGNILVIATDIRTAKPLNQVAIEIYDYQQQLISKGATNAEGILSLPINKETPYFVVAKLETERGYLKLNDPLSVSSFDIGGKTIDNGLKGFLYGERGVWRPGDSLFVGFIIEDKLKLFSDNQPVVFELQNPQGQVANRIVRSSSENGFYSFATATAANAPTGNWQARVKAGASLFTMPVKIETIKPNRLKINLNFGKDKLTASSSTLTGDLQVNWLYGAPGKKLKSTFDLTLMQDAIRFPKYPDHVFEDPSLEFYSETSSVFDGYTDAEGKAKVNVTIPSLENPPGLLRAVFRGKVFEEGGDFSIDNLSIPYYPYTSYTGIRLPKGDQARGMLLTDKEHQVDIVTIDADGKPLSRDIEVSLYKIDWRWWWDVSSGKVNYLSGNNAQQIAKATIKTKNGKGVWTFRVNYPEWGRYYVKTFDPESKYSSGKVVYIDWPGWAGRAREEGENASMLVFSSDKPKYNVDEKATLVIPGCDNGRALVSIENGSRVIQTFWVETKKEDVRFTFDITQEMAPNIFTHVTLLQPHNQTANDLPIRLYGVIPIIVENPTTHLEPVISMPDVLEPGQKVDIKISEKNDRTMTYTIAVVEEGLLDITRYKTPDVWNQFYAREALGVKTWDLFDYVIGSFAGQLDRLLAIGGSDYEKSAKKDQTKANRFKPVVKYFGPFTTHGKTNSHQFTMPQYIGSVKTMVVAGYEGAYGSVDKVTPVRKPLMVLATLPRVLGVDEQVKLPITVMTTEASIKSATVSVKVTGPVSITGSPKRQISCQGIGEVMTEFDLMVKQQTGVATIEVTVTSGKYTSVDKIEIDVQNPNPPITSVIETIIDSNKSWDTSVKPIGMAGTNRVMLEASTLPPINLGMRLNYLMQYPHGCIEQTTSSVFPQLYLNKIKAMSQQDDEKMQKNVRAGIDRIKLFMCNSGGFSYWPGGEDADSWGTSYAGHFLIEAEKAGYFVPNELLKQWKKYQVEKAREWRKSSEGSDELQAYRLYTLALAKSADVGAMNRMREQKISPTSMWLLAAAYATVGQEAAANQLIENLPLASQSNSTNVDTYGSNVRNEALILETLMQLNKQTKGMGLFKKICSELSNPNSWMSTQTTAWCLKVVSAFAQGEKQGNLKFSYTWNGKTKEAETKLPIAQVELASLSNNQLKLSNEGSGKLFVRIISTGIPMRGEETDEANNLNVSIMFADLKGNEINPENLEQGTEFFGEVTVTNPGLRGDYKNLALTQVFPSGWEIYNARLNGNETTGSTDLFSYQDIRDDRVLTYFDLKANEKKEFKVFLTAGYAGTYYLPVLTVEAMYDGSVYARKKGMAVQVVKTNPSVQ